MATRTACWNEGCDGIPMAVNDAASRLSEAYFGRIHYVCDKCRTRWSITPEAMNKELTEGRRQGRRQPRAKSFDALWAEEVDGRSTSSTAPSTMGRHSTQRQPGS